MSSDEHAEDGSGLIEELVARCLDESQGSGSEAVVARVCADRPELAPQVLERLARLARVGLLGAAPGAPRFPGYSVHARLGSGGMAVVYAGREEASGALVALKTADPRLAHSARALERFRREVEAASRLRHPRVVAVRSAGEVDGVPFYAMDFVPGATLGEILDELRSGARADQAEAAEPLTVADLQRAWRARHAGEGDPRGFWGRTYVECACRIALDVAEALEHVHEHGIVHRDVKPSNVLLDADGHGNLFDLGLAHLADDARLTRTGDFAGSPHYAAPEQIDGSPEALDARADVYGLGATLFELIALRPPFQAKTTPELLRRILKQDAPGLRQVAPWAPRELEAICRACLEKEPGHRYASAAELAADLRSFLGFLPVRARPVGLARRALRFARRNPAQALAAVLGVTLLAGAPLVLVVHGHRIADERDLAAAAAAEARREADENREVSSFLESLILRLDDRGDPAHQAVARELVDEARARLDAQGDIHPLTRASLFHTVARVLGGMGREIDAVPLLDRCFAIRASELGDAHPETQAAVQELAALHLRLGDRQSARALAERGLRAAPHDAGMTWAEAAAEETLGRIALEERDLDQAQVRLERALAGFRAGGRGGEVDAARALRSLGRLHLARGDGGRAEELLAEAQELVSSAWEPDLAELAEGARLLALVAEERGRRAEAAARWTESLHLHAKRGRALGPESLAALERLLPLQEQRLAADARPELVREAFEQYVLLGENRAAAGTAGAETAFERALELALRAPSPDQDLLGRAYLGRGRSLHASGLEDAAWADLARAEEVRALSGSVEAWVPGLFDVALRTARARGDADGLAGVLRDARAWFEGRIAAGGDADLADELRGHALLLFELGRGAEAETFVRGAELLARSGAPAAPGLALGLDGEDEFDAAMQRAITLLQAELDAEAAAVLERCTVMRPRDPVPRYNLACALAGAGQSERAMAALEQAVDLGYAYRERAAETTAADSDLAPLRGDPRFDVLLARIHALAAGAEAYAAEPAEYIPPGVDPAAGAPLLVVLHKNGETKDGVVSGVWRGVADELGCVLLAPSGRIPAGDAPEAGMLWLDSLERYAARSWYFEKPVRDALAAYKRRHAASPESVYIAGEELGGTLAFHLAVRSPELYRGCLLVDAAVPLELAADLAPSLSSLGLRVALIADPRWRPPGIPQGTTTPEYLVQTFRQLGEWGIETTLGTREDRSAEDAAPRLVAAMRFLSTGSREQ